MLDTPLQTTRATGIPPTAVRSSGQISSEARVLSAAAGAVLMLLGLKRGGGAAC